MTLRQWLHAAQPRWTTRCLHWALRCFSGPYAVVMRLRNSGYNLGAYQIHRAPVPVICVGNLSVGGTGKTPMVAWLCDWLRGQGLRVAIVSRGYGQLESGSNDEALELELRLPDVPHLQNPDRVAAVQLAHDELEMQLVVLDDGFQHRRLARDLDIVLIDASQPPSTDWPLPAGLMREGWSGLRRAQVIVLTRCSQAAAERLKQLRGRIARIAPQARLLAADHATTGLHALDAPWSDLTQLHGLPVLAFCGIGHPDGFWRTLEKLSVVQKRVFPDHHAYDAADVQSLESWAAAHPECVAVLCTMKDWVKLQTPRLAGLPLVALQISMKFSEPDACQMADLLRHVTAKIG